MLFSIQLYILNFFRIFDFFCGIPFIAEYFVGLLSLVYLILCCFLKKEGWNMGYVFNYYKLIKIVFCILIGMYVNIILNSNVLFNDGLFFGEYMLNNIYSINIKILLLFMFIFIYGVYQNYTKGHGTEYEFFIEFGIWLLGIFFFLLLLVSVYDLVCMFFLIIGLNICFYGLLIQNVILKKILTEVCLKYFLLSAISSILIGGGCLFIFYFCGTTNFLLINNFLVYKVSYIYSDFEFLNFKFGMLLLFFGFLFKLSLVPAHFWAPEIYEGLPTALLGLINLPIKLVFILLFFRIFKTVFHVFTLDSLCNFFIFEEIEVLIWIISILSMIWGGVNAVFEQKIKRFLAYSSINQLGFLVIGLLGFESSVFGLQVFLYFLIIYIINLWIFILVLSWYEGFFYVENFDNVKEIKGVTLIFFTDLKHIFKTKILYIYVPSFLINSFIVLEIPHIFSLFLGISLLSFAGIPPLPGFFVKFYILLYALKLEYFSIVLVGVVMSLVSAFYYLRVLRIFFFEEELFEQKIVPFIVAFQGFGVNKFLLDNLKFLKLFDFYLFFKVFNIYFSIFFCFLISLVFCNYIFLDNIFLIYCNYLISDFILLKA